MLTQSLFIWGDITAVIVFHLLQTIALTIVFFLTWTIYGFLASGVMVIYVELMLSCDKLEDVAGPLGLNDPYLCLPLATGLSEYLIVPYSHGNTVLDDKYFTTVGVNYGGTIVSNLSQH